MTTITPSKSTARNLRVAEAINHLIVVLSSANREYWAQDDASLLAELNADVAVTLETFTGNTLLSEALNASQSLLGAIDDAGNPVFTARAPTEKGRSDIGFDGSAFFIVPPVAE